MNDYLPPANYLDLLTRSVAELADQLRPSFESGDAAIPVPSCAARLGVLAGLWTHAPLKNELGSLVSLGEAVAVLSEALKEGTGCNTHSLEPALEQLTEVLESTLARLDTGESAESLAGDPVWLMVLSRLESAGTPLEIMDELDVCAGNWEARWSPGDMTGDQVRSLRKRWQTFREYGDAMFAADQQQKDSAQTTPVGGLSVILLVDSIFRRDQLLQKLHRQGFSVQTTTTVEEAVSRVRSSLPAQAIICDNLEPSNHLTRLARKQTGIGDRTPLVLVSSGGGRSAAELKRARRLGADGVWAEPFNVQPLAEIQGGRDGS